MAHRNRDDAAEEIEVLFAVGVPQVLHAGVVGDQRLGVVGGDGGKQELFIFAGNLFFGHEYLPVGCTLLRWNAKLLPTPISFSSICLINLRPRRVSAPTAP